MKQPDGSSVRWLSYFKISPHAGAVSGAVRLNKAVRGVHSRNHVSVTHSKPVSHTVSFSPTLIALPDPTIFLQAIRGCHGF